MELNSTLVFKVDIKLMEVCFELKPEFTRSVYFQSVISTRFHQPSGVLEELVYATDVCEECLMNHDCRSTFTLSSIKTPFICINIFVLINLNANVFSDIIFYYKRKSPEIKNA